jgi:photosystem II stability/assembly factor-like uncharacterized protein
LGSAYLSGQAYNGFPVTPGTPQPVSGGGALLAKLGNTGASLTYATYLVGSTGTAIAVDSGGNAYITGYTQSPDLPVTASAPQPALGGGNDAFVAKLNSTGTAWQYATYLGGKRDDFANSIAVDSAGNAIVAGDTISTDFPRVAPVQPRMAGNSAVLSRTASGGSSWAAADAGIPDRVNAIAIDPASDSHLFALTYDNLYETSNSGADWLAVQGFLAVPSAVAFAPEGGMIYAAGYFYFYSSTDGGATWTRGGDTFCLIENMAVDPVNPSTIYAGGASLNLSAGCPEKSTDGGATWKTMSVGYGGVYGYAIDPQSTSTVYAATSFGLYKTTDGGQTWTEIYVLGPQTYVNAVAVVLNPQQPSLVYTVANGTVYRSADAGNSWTPSGPVGSVISLAIAPSNPSVLYAGTNSSGMLISTNGAASWSPAGLAQEYIPAIAVSSVRPALAYAVANVYTDAFVAKIDAAGDKLVYSTYLGGSYSDYAMSVATNSTGDAFITGFVSSPDFPTTPGAFQPATGFPRGTALVVRITQKTPACSYSASPASSFFYASGGLANVSLLAPSGCKWSATPSAPWIRVASGSGPGTAPLVIDVAANTGAARTGTIAIGTASIAITQAAAGCIYSLSTNSLTFPQSGGPQSVSVTAGAGCQWLVTGLPLWLSVTAGGIGAGNGTVTLQAAPNPFSGGRPFYSFTINVANNSVAVSQSGTSAALSH